MRDRRWGRIITQKDSKAHYLIAKKTHRGSLKDKREEKQTAHFYVIFSRPFCGDIFKSNSSILEKRGKGKEKERKKEERS